VSRRRIAITGIRGYVGGAVAVAAGEAGHDVIALSRSENGRYPWRSYDLARPIAPGTLDAVDVVVHCAYDLSLTRAADVYAVNVQGTSRLLEAASNVGARVCLISSMSAYVGTRQLYGRAKLACEHEVQSAGGDAVRLGLVYGGRVGGMIGTLSRVVSLPLFPVVGASSHQFTVHVHDMALALVRLVEREKCLSAPVGLAHPAPVRFDDLLRRLAAAQGKQPMLIPVPWRPVYGAMRLFEGMGLRLPLRADSLLGLVRPAISVPQHEAWATMGVRVRPFDEGIKDLAP
jgi:nucleoside-diphosphate-sugar epimerase